MVEHPVVKVKRSYEGLTIEEPVTAAAADSDQSVAAVHGRALNFRCWPLPTPTTGCFLADLLSPPTASAFVQLQLQPQPDRQHDADHELQPGQLVRPRRLRPRPLDVQCLPHRAFTAQHFRVTQDGNPQSFFNVDMTTSVVFSQMVPVVDTTYSMIEGQPIRTAVWVADKSCSGSTCSLTAMVAPERSEVCIGGGDCGYSCTNVEPFLKVYAACRAGTQSGDNIQDTVRQGDSGCTNTSWTAPSAMRRRPAGRPTPASTSPER